MDYRLLCSNCRKWMAYVEARVEHNGINYPVHNHCLPRSERLSDERPPAKAPGIKR